MYYSLTLLVTTSVTVTEVLVLELHFRSNSGLPLPPRLVRMASWMAALTFTKLDFAPTQTTVMFVVSSGPVQQLMMMISEEQTQLCRPVV